MDPLELHTLLQALRRGEITFEQFASQGAAWGKKVLEERKATEQAEKETPHDSSTLRDSL